MSNPEFNIYTAGAGAGKTYALSQQILKRLWQSEDVNYFQHTLAMTFTNKAANEMKRRLLGYLHAAANYSSAPQKEQTEIKRFVQEVGLEISEVSSKSQQILRAILHNYSRLSISTIDKFNLGLIKAFSKELGVSNSFEVELNVQQVLAEAIDLLFESATESKILMKSLKNEIDLRLRMNKSWDLRKDFFDRLESKFNDADAQYLAFVEGKTQKELVEISRKLWEGYKDAQTQLEKRAQEIVQLCAANDVETEDMIRKSGNILGVAQKILSGKKPGGIKYALDSLSNRELAHTETKKRAEIEGIQDEVFRLFEELLSFWGDELRFYALIQGMGSLTVWNQIRAHIATINSYNNRMLISDFNRLISRHIQQQPASFLYEKIGVWYKHYFIDEFQDTSEMQWRNFYPLLEEAQSSGNTAMLVGDVKQAIYSFRGGSSKLMINVIENKENLLFEQKRLSKNYRSHANIVEFNNSFFGYIKEFFQNQALAKQFSERQEVTSNEKGYVEMRLIEESDQNLDTLLEQIQTAEESGYSTGEMCILLHKRSDIREVSEYLLEQGYTVFSDVSLLLKDHPVIGLLQAVFLVPESNYSDERLWQVWTSYHELFPQADWVTEFTKYKGMGKIGFQQMQTDLNLRFLSDNWKRETLMERIQFLVSTLELEKNGGAFLQAYLDYVFDFQTKNGSSVSAFMEQWKLDEPNLSADVAPDPKAIRIMTIHKSKGLEFPVVLLPRLFGTSKTDGEFWVTTQTDILPFAEIKLKETVPFDIYEEQKLEEKNSREMDAVNKQYVATTRSSEQLYIIVDSKKLKLPYEKEIPQFSPDLEEQGIFRMGEPQRETKLATQNHKNPASESLAISLESYPWQDKLHVARAINPSALQAQATGNILHDVLARIANPSDVPMAACFLEQQRLDSQLTAYIRSSIDKIISHPDLRQFFLQDIQVLNEREFVSVSGVRFRPDRLVEFEPRAWAVLDYKTGNPRKEDVEQVQEYVDFLTELNYPIQRAYLVQIHNEIAVKEVPLSSSKESK